jgi:hypothetical protein
MTAAEVTSSATTVERYVEARVTHFTRRLLCVLNIQCYRNRLARIESDVQIRKTWAKERRSKFCITLSTITSLSKRNYYDNRQPRPSYIRKTAAKPTVCHQVRSINSAHQHSGHQRYKTPRMCSVDANCYMVFAQKHGWIHRVCLHVTCFTWKNTERVLMKFHIEVTTANQPQFMRCLL